MTTSKSIIGTKIVRLTTKETGTVIDFDQNKNRVQIAWDILRCKLGSDKYFPAIKKGWITIKAIDIQ